MTRRWLRNVLESTRLKSAWNKQRSAQLPIRGTQASLATPKWSPRTNRCDLLRDRSADAYADAPALANGTPWRPPRRAYFPRALSTRRSAGTQNGMPAVGPESRNRGWYVGHLRSPLRQLGTGTALASDPTTVARAEGERRWAPWSLRVRTDCGGGPELRRKLVTNGIRRMTTRTARLTPCFARIGRSLFEQETVNRIATVRDIQLFR